MECIVCQEEKELFHKLNSCIHSICIDCKTMMLSSSLCYDFIMGEKCIKCPQCREIEKIPYAVLFKKAENLDRDCYHLSNAIRSIESEHYILLKKLRMREQEIKQKEKENMELLEWINITHRICQPKRKGECNRGCISKKTKKITKTTRKCSNESCDNYSCRECDVCLMHN